MNSITPQERLALLKNNMLVACSELLDYYHSPVDTISIEILEAEFKRHSQRYLEAKSKIILLSRKTSSGATHG